MPRPFGAPDVRRMVPVQSTDDGRFAGHPLPFKIVPPQSPNSGSLGAWLMTTFCPATVSGPGAGSAGFAGTLNETGPGPVCGVALVTVTNEALVVTVHEHPLPVVTVNVAPAPAPDTLKVVVESA